MKELLKKNYIWNIIGTGLNAFSSLFYMIIVTRVNGIDDAGIFSFAFSIACLFYIIGIYNGRVYQVTETSEIKDSDFFANKIITCFAMLFVSIAFITINRYDLYKSLIILGLCLLKTFEAYSEVIFAIFQKNNKLYKSGISFTIKNVLGLLTFLIVNLITHKLIYSIIALILSHLVVFVLYDLKELKSFKMEKEHYNKKNIMRIFKEGFFSFTISFLSVYLINSSRYVMDAILAENFQTIFAIILMPATIVSLIAQFIIYPYMNEIKESIVKRDYENIKQLLYKFLKIIILIGIVCIVLAYFLGIPIVKIVYGIDLTKYLNCLIIIMIGATFTACAYVLSSFLIAMRKTLIQFICYLIVSILSSLSAKMLIMNYGILGASCNYLIWMAVIFILFFKIIRICLNNQILLK